MPSVALDAARIYRFGDFELNASTRQLLRRGRRIAIQPRPFDVLLYLIRHRDRVVPREELLAEVWRGVHVNAQAVGFTLHATRKAVDDDGDRQAVIRTVSRAGFQFVAAIQEVATPPDRVPQGQHETPSIRLPRSALLGRDRLMRETAVLLEEVAQGGSRVLLLSGEAGIGKTRALEQLAELAESRAFRVFHGRCVESEGAPAFWPWIQILRSAVGADPPSGLLRALGEGAREVAWMVPELRPFVPEVPEARSMDARAARFLLFDSVSTFFEQLAADVPHLLCIDDLHRADAASAALFEHVARDLGRVRAPRLALVGTYREGELRMAPPLAEPLISVTRLPHGRLEPLRGLECDDVEALVRALSGCVPSKTVIADLHQKTNGNPFFLDQILRVLHSEGRLHELESSGSLDLELPGHVQDAIRQQLRLLSSPARDLIGLASVVGRDFQVAELELAARLERSAVLSLLDLAMEAGILGERAGTPGGYRFVHVLVRDATYAGLPLDVRARNHECIARALEERFPHQPSAEAASIAHHYAQASARSARARSAHYYEMAASWATACGAFEDAPDHLDRALQQLGEVAPLDLSGRCRLMLQLGDALTNVGARDRAREVLQAAVEIAHRADLSDEIAIAALRFAPDLLAIETGVYDPDLVRLLEGAISAQGESETPLRARLLARLANALQWNRDQEARGKALCEEAVAIAARAGDAETRQYVDTVEALINFSLVHPERQLARVPNPSGSSASLELLQRLLRVTSLLLLGRVVEADAEILCFSELVAQSRHPQARWYVDLLRATRALMEGRYEEATESTSRYLVLGEKYGDRNAAQSHYAQSLMRAFDFGGLEIHELRTRSIVEAFPRMVAWRAALALVLTELDRVEDARLELHRVIDSRPLETSRPNEWYGTATALALTCGTVNEPEIAEKLYATLLPHAEQLVVFGYSSYCVGSAQRLLAALASGMGQWNLAASHFDAAESMNAAIGAHACNVRVYFERARMLRAAGQRSEGMRWAGRAAEVAAEFGMTRLAARSRDLAS